MNANIIISNPSLRSDLIANDKQLSKWFTKAIQVVVLLLATTLLAYPAENSVLPRINNPTATTPEEWPAMVMLVNKGTSDLRCGGTLIAKQWVLTAGHCVTNRTTFQAMTGNSLDILVKRSKTNSFVAERVTIENIVVHPDFPNGYRKGLFNNDIALIKLSVPLSIEPINLLSTYSDLDNENIVSTAIGWGVTSYANDIWGILSKQLNKVELPVVSHAACLSQYAKSYYSITDNMLCAGYLIDNKGDTCHGDSGGPLVVFDAVNNIWQQIGITSFGVGKCGFKNNYGVYTRVKNYKKVISEQICSAGDRPTIPILKSSVVNKLVKLTWQSTTPAVNYRLTYKARNDRKYHDLEMGKKTDFNVILPNGSDYDVWITAFNGNCDSEYSVGVRVLVAK